MILKTLGAEVKGAPGTWQKGIDAASEVLAELGLAKDSYQLRNGSGLNDTNRFSAHQMTMLLSAMWKRFNVSAEFVSSLSVAARDGTLRLRMEGTDAAGRLRAKTGTLDKVTALSGFLQAVGGERMVFSLIVNDWSGRPGPVIASVDRFGAALASAGMPEPTLRESSLLALGDKAELLPAELKARLASYAQLAATPDPKNAPFLRAEIRSARDPLLKAAAADALYRSAPEGGGGAALLDALPVGPELYAHLRAVGRELLLPLPLISTLLDLGAEGSGEALARLVALAPLGRGPSAEPELEQALAEGLFDVSEAAPDEVRAALQQAPDAQAAAAIELITLGMAAAGQDPAKSLLAGALAEAASKPVPEAEKAKKLREHLVRKEPPAGEALSAAGPAQVPAGTVLPPPPGEPPPGPAPDAQPLGGTTSDHPQAEGFVPPPFIRPEAPFEVAPDKGPRAPEAPAPAARPGPASAPPAPLPAGASEPHGPDASAAAAPETTQRQHKKRGRRRARKAEAIQSEPAPIGVDARPGG